MFAPTAQPAILVLGGTGKVGSRIVRQLLSSPSHSDYTILVASRNGSSDSSNLQQQHNNGARVQHVPFDWHNPDTWRNPFSLSTTTSTTTPAGISAIYLIAPPSLDADVLMTKFIDFARERGGVRRFVLQSASSIEAGGPAMGKVHAYLEGLGREGEVEWAVLKPTWFQQNFVDQPVHLKAIKEESAIYSATGEGKIPWVSADDIAAVAVQALTNPSPPNTDYMVLGPELLSYGEIAEILTEVLGRRIVHVDLSAAELEKRHQSFGMPEDYAKMISAMDLSIRAGAENRTSDVVLRVTGERPRKFRDLAESVNEVWEPSGRV
ncbi:hypothetical protein C8A05DRAFT_14906 [Staphylotrichum tortipilum]|uniref:NmrA-like domain-containing protein n=1 Tax=Staphylotrichum tortipilum TaxID=2831512 RepID=A0AAN6MMS7_9PEZI|nr:hypothetical protein C8A05DRAFT_14906 [Staphylotrichum longicolle]